MNLLHTKKKSSAVKLLPLRTQSNQLHNHHFWKSCCSMKTWIHISFVIMISIVASLGFKRSALWRSAMTTNKQRMQVLGAASSTLSSSSNEVKIVDHPSYDRLNDFVIKEYGLSGSIYNHRQSGAQVISVHTIDDNKVFGITFRTPPKDSTGVPHILEHSVLCGSRKFPVKEPFVDLLKGSLQNFLNAFTYPDRTCYPVASTNTKDFYNLIHVYLDAVLHPRAINDPQVLQQEGWHYELEDVQDPLKIKGVVFNEMKGVYSSPDSLMGRAVQQALFPHNTYGVDSGGDPAAISTLTFDQFKAFHQSYYHPANSRVFFYGNDDPQQRLVLLDDYLKDFQRIPVDSQVHFQKKHDKSNENKITVPFPIAADSEPKHMITINWLLNDQVLSTKDSLAMELLDYLMLGTSTSSLRKILVESNLGESVTGGGLSDELLQSTFSAGLKGVKAEHVDQVTQLVQKTLTDLSNTGFEEDAIQAAINTLEFKLREFNTGSFPKGLSIMLGMMKNWIYDRNPIDAISFEGALQELKADLKANKPVFQDLLKKYFVNNTHRVVVEMIPDKELENQQNQAEEKQLQSIKSSMSPAQLEEIIKSTKSLREAQERVDSPEARATLPKLGLEDIEKKTREVPFEVVKDVKQGDAYTLLTHALPTAGILYADMGFDYSNIDMEDITWLPLFSRMLMEAGTKNYDATTLSRKIGANTGGISVSFYSDFKGNHGRVSDSDDALLYLMIRGKATADKIPTLFELFQEILLNANLDNQKRALEMLKESKIRKESSVLSNGHSFSASRLASRQSFLGYMNELTGGITSVREAGKLLEYAEKNWPEVQAKLERIRQRIIHSVKSPSAAPGARKVIINLTAEQAVLDQSLSTINNFLQHLPQHQDYAAGHLLKTWKADKQKLIPASRNEGFVIPSMVNYVGMGGSVYKQNEEVAGSSSVVARYLSTGYMWDQVRVLGGAYGGFARFSESSGRFVYLSYRDPNVLQTLQTYDHAAEFLNEQEVSSEEILQAIIGSIGDIDSPMSSDQQGYVSLVQFMIEESATDRQRWRDSILQTSPEDFKKLAQRLSKLREEGTITVFGSQQAIDQANAELPAEKKLVVEPAFTSSPK